jgi:hypothetical protein
MTKKWAKITDKALRLLQRDITQTRAESEWNGEIDRKE